MADPNDPQILRLAARLGEPVETDDDLSLAEACLNEAWEWARIHGAPEWSFEDPSTPGIAKTVVLSAAMRGYQNVPGFLNERGDSVTFERHEAFAKGTEFTAQEIAALKKASRTGGRVTSLRLTNPDQYRARGRKVTPSILAYPTYVGDPDHGTVNLYGWST
jgi:glucuronate isomerase